ncbi:MAG: LTA synthase family protein [bacterium]|nr:LTA synthase family protein [bacterium]
MNQESTAPPPEHSESDLPVILWVIPFVLTAMTPGMQWVVGESPMSIRIALGVAMSLFVLIFSVILLVILSRGLQSRIRWALGVATATTLAFFQWPALTRTGDRIADALNIGIISDVLPVLLAVALLWLAIRLAGDRVFAVLLMVSTVAIVAVSAVTAAPRVNGSPEPVATVTAAPGSPDVLLLVLDGYAGDRILMENFDYDNSAFYSSLKERGFEIAMDAKANYAFTYAALSSMLNLDYVFDVGEISEAELSLMRKSLSGDPELYRLFHERGYDVAFAENAWTGSYCGGAVDACWRDGIAERALWNLSRLTILAPLLSDIRPHTFNTISYDNLKHLPEVVEIDRKDGVPRLTVAHVILPHPPLLLDSACNRQSDTNRRPLRVTDPDVLDERRPYYVDQLICTNATVLDALDEILAARSDTVIMITGDHGTELTRSEETPISEWTDDEIAPRMEIFSAYRLPGCDEAIYPELTPVNGMRVATNCAIDAGLDAVTDEMYWAPTDIAGVVVDVGPRLTK